MVKFHAKKPIKNWPMKQVDVNRLCLLVCITVKGYFTYYWFFITVIRCRRTLLFLYCLNHLENVFKWNYPILSNCRKYIIFSRRSLPLQANKILNRISLIVEKAFIVKTRMPLGKGEHLSGLWLQFAQRDQPWTGQLESSGNEFKQLIDRSTLAN